MQDLTFGMPSTSTRHDEHFPIAQKNPLAWLCSVNPNISIPFAISALAIVSLGSAQIGWPSK